MICKLDIYGLNKRFCVWHHLIPQQYWQFLSLSNIDGKCDTFRTFTIVICNKLQLKFQEEKI